VKITLAHALGTCFGVQDAIDAALDPSFRGNLTIVGQLVHNPQVVEELRANGVRMVDSAAEAITTPNVMITAHGAARSVKEGLEARGHTVYDASCPLVMKVHNRVAQLVAEGYFPVVIGQRPHVEVRGIVGDLVEYDVLGGPEEVDRLAGRDRIGIVCQTTQQVEHARAIVAAIRGRFPTAEVRFVDTICRPTKERQEAVRELAEQVDVMVVVGGYNSSNTKKLKKVCDDRGLPAHHIERPEELRVEWFAGREHVGITAGTSTPPGVIESVHRRIREIAQQLASAAPGA
jgi:4-hydroxy-3-methylbut-2-enyl diphosphate reductase